MRLRRTSKRRKKKAKVGRAIRQKSSFKVKLPHAYLETPPLPRSRKCALECLAFVPRFRPYILRLRNSIMSLFSRLPQLSCFTYPLGDYRLQLSLHGRRSEKQLLLAESEGWRDRALLFNSIVYCVLFDKCSNTKKTTSILIAALDFMLN